MKTGKAFACKLLAFFLLIQFVQQPLSAQELIGYNYNNYIGVNGIVSNPASIAASRYKVHVNLLTVNAYGGSNAYEISSKKFFKFQFSGWSEGQDFRKVNNDEKKSGWANADILGPSFMVNLKTKGALGFTTRVRTLVNAYNLSNGSFNLISNPDQSIYGTDFKEKNIKVNATSFADVGLTYAKILKNKGKTFIKGGVTMKYVHGLSSAYLKVDSLNVNIQDLTNIQKLNGSGSLVYAENLDALNQNSASSYQLSDLSKNYGTLGLDLGVVYEHRSGRYAPRYGTMKSLFRTIPYDFRFSFSVTDFAFAPLKFKPGQQSASYALTADNVRKDTFDVQNGETTDDYLQNLQVSNLINKRSGSGEFEMPLPTSIRANFDWQALRYFFINADAMISLRGAKSETSGTNYISTISVTPRFEKQWYTVYSPVSVNIQRELNWGAGFRLGPLFAGSGSVLSNLLKSDFKSIDAHVGLSIPVYQGVREKRVKNKPQDQAEQPKPVVEKKQEKAAKAQEKKKFQDKDKDGVEDASDACPETAGPVENNGCPDTDKDGIADDKDKCPTVTGTIKYNGCPVPDADNDGVTDEADKCPKVAGPVTNNGCPEIKQEIRKKVATAASNLFFVSNKATIQIRSYPALNKLAAILRADSTLFLDIEGHTDSFGKDAHNLKLSQSRADAAKAYLVELGISADRIGTKGYGETEPIAPNTTAAGRAKNRRIVLKLRNY